MLRAVQLDVNSLGRVTPPDGRARRRVRAGRGRVAPILIHAETLTFELVRAECLLEVYEEVLQALFRGDQVESVAASDGEHSICPSSDTK